MWKWLKWLVFFIDFFSLKSVGARNAGVYTCKPAQLQSSSIQLYVLDDKGNQGSLL